MWEVSWMSSASSETFSSLWGCPAIKLPRVTWVKLDCSRTTYTSGEFLTPTIAFRCILKDSIHLMMMPLFVSFGTSVLSCFLRSFSACQWMSKFASVDHYFPPNLNVVPCCIACHHNVLLGLGRESMWRHRKTAPDTTVTSGFLRVSNTDSRSSLEQSYVFRPIDSFSVNCSRCRYLYSHLICPEWASCSECEGTCACSHGG